MIAVDRPNAVPTIVGVGLAGTAFGAYGEGYLRLSIANSEANLAKALEQIETMLRATAGVR